MKKEDIAKIPNGETIALLEGILEQSPDCITIVDANGYVIKVNKAYENLTGVTSGEIVGSHITELVNQGILEEALGLSVIKEKKTMSAMQMLPRTGKSVLVTINPVFDQAGKLIYIIGATRDMDALNRLKDELEKVRETNKKYKEEVVKLKERLKDIQNNVIFQSQKMGQIIELGKRIANIDLPILITGESGVGKEVIARFIQSVSNRKMEKFVTINCAAIPEELIESELFGYLPGAFTGAGKNGKKGLFEIADNGTLFLDEIGELPLSMQVKLLRILEDMSIRPLGGTVSKKVNVRIIAATNRSLEEEIKKGQFREDLYYRLSVVPLHIPPLRERREDILLLVNHFCERFNEKYHAHKSFSLGAIRVLEKCDWYGNVRELKNVVERLIVCSMNTNIQPNEVYEHLKSMNLDVDAAYQTVSIINEMNVSSDMRQTIRAIERDMIADAMAKYGSSRKAAASLGMSQSTFLRKLKWKEDH